MDNSNTTADTLDQADEEILDTIASDEALEATAGTERRALPDSHIVYTVPL